MKTTRHTITAGSMLAAALAAQAGVVPLGVTGTVTADNHYAIYTSVGKSFSYIGGNETGVAGSQGAYNWSRAETWTFPTSQYLYIAAWSDDRVAQGLIGEFFLPNGASIVTDDLHWEVFATGIDLDDGSPHPEVAQIVTQVALADENNLWSRPGIYMNNSAQTSPWGHIPGIGADANWIWATPPDGANVFVGDGNWSEYLIFRTPVPAPGGALALAGATFVALGRRRR